MPVLTVITRATGALPLARLGYRVALATEARLVILCVEDGDGNVEPIVSIPGDPLPEGTSVTVEALCRELECCHQNELRDGDGEGKSERILPAPVVEVRRLRTTCRFQAVMAQIADVEADVLVAARYQERDRGVPLAGQLFTAAPCHMILARLGESEESRCERILRHQRHRHYSRCRR